MNPLFLLLAGLGAGAGALVLLDEPQEVKAAKIVVALKQILPPLPPAASATKDTAPGGTGPLPPQALQAYADDNNKLRSAGYDRWFRWAKFSKKTKKKIDKLRFYANPPGLQFRTSKSDVNNLCWMARCPSAWYPKHGGGNDRNCRVDAIDQWLSPKAGWKTFTGALGQAFEALPAIVEGAGVVAGGVTTGGGSIASDPGASVGTVVDALKAALTPIGNTGKSISKRQDAADAVLMVLIAMYRRQMMLANPHAVRNGELVVGKYFMENPKTFEDLAKPGKARPLLFNPELKGV